jgi:thioredoxin reductase (NADPH)
MLSGKLVGSVVLVVDDEPDILESLVQTLGMVLPGVEAVGAPSGDQGLEVLRSRQVDAVLSDYKMPRMNGIDFLAEAEKLAPGAARMLVTAYADARLAIEAVNRAHIDHFFTKPVDIHHVGKVLAAALEARQAVQARDEAYKASLARVAPA